MSRQRPLYSDLIYRILRWWWHTTMRPWEIILMRGFLLATVQSLFNSVCVCVCVKCVACICQTRTMSARNHALTRLHNHETYEYRATKGYPQNCRSMLLECLLLKYVLHGEIFQDILVQYVKNNWRYTSTVRLAWLKLKPCLKHDVTHRRFSRYTWKPTEIVADVCLWTYSNVHTYLQNLLKSEHDRGRVASDRN